MLREQRSGVLRWAVYIGIALSFTARPVRAQPPTQLERQLYQAMRRVVSLGNGEPVAHCRNAGPPTDGTDPWERCRVRLQRFARYIATASERHDVDPWTLTAMAVKESGLHPFVIGAHGEGGLLQLHPQGIGAHVRFVTSAAHRRACRTQPGACQEEVIDVGARHLAENIARCGSEEQGLGAFNSGACAVSRYVHRVLEIRAELRSAD